MREELWPDGDHDAEVAALLDRPTFAAFIARVGGAAMGFAEATMREYVDGADVGIPVVYLEGLWVDAAHRRHGIASALLAAVTAWGSAHGATTIGSDADAENADGLDWHAALGFEEVGRTVNFVRPTIRPFAIRGGAGIE